MQISQMLLNPDLQRLKVEFERLGAELDEREKEEQLKSIQGVKQKNLARIDKLHSSLNDARERGDLVHIASANTYSTYRKIKRDLRFAQRRLKRMVSQNGKQLKPGEQAHDVATFAA